MFRHSITIYTYIDKNNGNLKVLAATEPQEFSGKYESGKLTISCCAFSAYFNKTTNEFSVHPDTVDKDWMQLPWNEWFDINNPDVSNTFSAKAQAFTNRILGR